MIKSIKGWSEFEWQRVRGKKDSDGEKKHASSVWIQLKSNELNISISTFTFSSFKSFRLCELVMMNVVGQFILLITFLTTERPSFIAPHKKIFQKI